MLQIIFRETVSFFGLVWLVLNFIWLGFTSFLDWLECISHPILKANPFWAQFGFFFVSLLFLPFPWWVSFIFIFLPPMFAASLLIFFYLLFIASLSFGIVFV